MIEDVCGLECDINITSHNGSSRRYGSAYQAPTGLVTGGLPRRLLAPLHAGQSDVMID